MSNSTTAALAHIVYAPVRLLTSIPQPHFTYVPAAYVKLKTDSIAMVFFCIARQIWVYVEGWRDCRRRRRGVKVEKADNEEHDKKRRKTKAKLVSRRRTRGRILLRGRYTLIL
jgi:hypothetical protein